jgi:SRSO17 transposase
MVRSSNRRTDTSITSGSLYHGRGKNLRKAVDPELGHYAVGVARQYCGALGKIANCQVAVTAALWTGTRAWLLGALLYLPQSWIEDATRRAVAHIPASVSFQEKWWHAITLIRRARAAGLQLTAVVADAEFGDITAFRRLLHQWRLPYALGISPHLTVFRGTPAVHIPPSLFRRWSRRAG